MAAREQPAKERASKDRLWRGGFPSRRAAAIGLLAGPALLTAAVWLLAVSVGMLDDYDGPRVVSYLVKQVAVLSLLAAALYGLPAALVLARFDRAGLLPLLLAGAGPGVLALLAAAFRRAPLTPPVLLGAAVVMSCGAFAAGVFWLAARRLDRR